MNLFAEIVENPHFVPAAQECVGTVGTNESGSTGDKNGLSAHGEFRFLVLGVMEFRCS